MSDTIWTLDRLRETDASGATATAITHLRAAPEPLPPLPFTLAELPARFRGGAAELAWLGVMLVSPELILRLKLPPDAGPEEALALESCPRRGLITRSRFPLKLPPRFAVRLVRIPELDFNPLSIVNGPTRNIHRFLLTGFRLAGCRVRDESGAGSLPISKIFPFLLHWKSRLRSTEEFTTDGWVSQIEHDSFAP